ncbi:unnamed protein product [Symbiodinium sp. CCMP2592]|nr:unnamed protein product [Symbiodinium sp. CCMP2592]
MKVSAEAFRDLKVICITEEENGLSEDTIALTRSFIVRMVEHKVDACGSIFIWAELDTMPRKLWGIQRMLWKNLCLLVSPVEGMSAELQPYFAVEWPKTCQYWTWKDVKKMLASRERPVITSFVDGCAVGMIGADGALIHKRWRVDTDFEPLACALNSIRCTKDHVHSENFNLRETQHYPVALCDKVLQSLK